VSKSLSMYGGAVRLEFDDAAHAYRYQDKFVPGVTSILKLLDKPALVQWAANCAVEHITNGYIARLEAGEMPETTQFLALCQEAKTAHRRISKAGIDVGSLVHRFAEQVLVDRKAVIPSDPKAAKGAAAFLDWYHSHKIEPIHVERMVFSKTWYYAGTVDFYGRIDDELCVLDFKTSSGLYLEMPLQLAAYAVAIIEETGERIDTGWIVRLDKKTGKCQPYRIPLAQQTKDAWLRVREAHELVSKIEDQLDGLRKNAA
jgi:hypothetical protein